MKLNIGSVVLLIDLSGGWQCMAAKEPYDRGLEIKSTNPKHAIDKITIDEVFQKVQEQLN